MTDTITLTGLVATTPRHLVTSEGLPITSFRLASTQRRYDRGAQKWIDAETNWYTVTCFRQLAMNAVGSIAKGQRVVVSGRVKVRDWQSGDRAGTTVEIDADALGHDLFWGTSVFTRSVAATMPNDPEAPSDRAAVLEAGDPPEAGEQSDDGLNEHIDEVADSSRALEAALPF